MHFDLARKYVQCSPENVRSKHLPVAHITEANIQLIKDPWFVHIKVDGRNKPRIADPRTKNGKSDVKLDRTLSSVLGFDTSPLTPEAAHNLVLFKQFFASSK